MRTPFTTQLRDQYANKFQQHDEALAAIVSMLENGTGVSLLSSAFTFTRNADPVDGTTFHGRLSMPSGITGKAPWVIDTTKQSFNGTPDPVLTVGYNHLANGGKLQSGEHSLSWNIEADYNDGVNRTMEAYLTYKSANGLTEVRPLMIQFNRATDKVTGMNLGGGGPIYLQLSDAGTGGVDFQRSTSSARIRITGGSNEIFQIGNISGITTISIGPSSISGTAEIVTTANAVAINAAATVTGPNNQVVLTAVQVGSSSRAIDVQKSSSVGSIRLAGGANELMQIGNVAGITTVQIGPSAISGTAELVMTSTQVTCAPAFRVNGNIGFYNTAPVAKPTASGSRGGNAALASLLTALASQGLITDSTTA